MLCNGLYVNSITLYPRGEDELITHRWVHKPRAFPLGLRPPCPYEFLDFLTRLTYHIRLFLSWRWWESDPFWKDRPLRTPCPSESPKTELVYPLIRWVYDRNPTPNDPMFDVIRD